MIVVEPLLAHMWQLDPPLNTYYGTAVQFEHAKRGSTLSFYKPEDSTLLAGGVTIARDPVKVTDPAVQEKAKQLYKVLSARGLSVAREFGVVVWNVTIEA